MSLFQNFPLLFFILLVPLSGFIAWAGDRIGHRIGKRRQTFFGLRPRHTATVTTIASGMVISLVSFGLMWVSNETFRMVLRDGAELLQSNRELRTENKTLFQTIDRQRTRVADLRRESEEARGRVEKSRAAQEAAIKAQHAAETTLARARRFLQSARGDLTAARGDLKTTRAELKAKTRRVEAARRQVAAAEAVRDRAAADARRAEAAAREARARQVESEKLLANAARTFESVTSQQRAEIERQKEELKRVTNDLESRRAELANLLVSNTSALRRNRITYEVNEEIDRTTLPSGMSAEDVQMALWKVLRSAAVRARERGAAVSPNGRAVIILPKQVTDERKEDGAEMADEADSVAAAAESIHSAQQDVAILVVATANAVEGEPVPVEFRTYRNRQILARGAVLGTISVDGTLPQPAVANTLYAFLRRDIRRRLLDAGLIPPATERGAADPGENIVSISGDRWFQLLDEVRRAGKDAKVSVRTDTDLRAADPVTLSFEVSPRRGVSSTDR